MPQSRACYAQAQACHAPVMGLLCPGTGLPCPSHGLAMPQWPHKQGMRGGCTQSEHSYLDLMVSGNVSVCACALVFRGTCC